MHLMWYAHILKVTSANGVGLKSNRARTDVKCMYLASDVD